MTKFTLSSHRSLSKSSGIINNRLAYSRKMGLKKEGNGKININDEAEREGGGESTTSAHCWLVSCLR